MKITPYENGHCFLVTSRSREGVHMVDLTENECLGACSCEHFKFTLYPAFKASGQQSIDDSHRCAHIQFCREWLLNDLIRRLKRPRELSASDRRKIEKADKARANQTGI